MVPEQGTERVFKGLQKKARRLIESWLLAIHGEAKHFDVLDGVFEEFDHVDHVLRVCAQGLGEPGRVDDLERGLAIVHQGADVFLAFKCARIDTC